MRKYHLIVLVVLSLALVLALGGTAVSVEKVQTGSLDLVVSNNPFVNLGEIESKLENVDQFRHPERARCFLLGEKAAVAYHILDNYFTLKGSNEELEKIFSQLPEEETAEALRVLDEYFVRQKVLTEKGRELWGDLDSKSNLDPSNAAWHYVLNKYVNAKGGLLREDCANYD